MKETLTTNKKLTTPNKILKYIENNNKQKRIQQLKKTQTQK